MRQFRFHLYEKCFNEFRNVCELYEHGSQYTDLCDIDMKADPLHYCFLGKLLK